ncbi:Lipoprotein [Flavobacterium chungbukense]|uniref:Lipoprotein n=2 Tax=Flavobacterium chungbukense TaxID=877464 RepID=A0ABP7Y949_9FLAO
MKIQNLLFLLLVIVTFSCNKDENREEVLNCKPTSISMVVNGKPQTFQALGYGIDLRSEGYELHLNGDRRSNDPFREQGIAVILPYKKTGKNIIQKFLYHQYIDNVSFDGDFIKGEFECDVIINRNSCFYATFSGKLNDGNQEVMITDGIISYQYDDAFDN